MALPSLPYDNAQSVLNCAVGFANDAGSPLGIAGNILNPTRNPAVLPLMQERWRYLQQKLISSGVDTFTKDAVIPGLTATASNDPSVRMILTYNGYWNGQVWAGPNVSASQWSNAATYTQGMVVTYNNSYYVALPNSTTNLNQEPDSSVTFWQPFNQIGPCLPPDLVKPLEAWERPAGGPRWVPMRQVPDSLPNGPTQPRFGCWGFLNDRLVMPGCSQANDLLLKYVAMAPDIAGFDSVLMVRGCTTALSYMLLDAVGLGRGGPLAEQFKQRAEEAIGQIVNQTVRKMAYSEFVRQPYRSSRSRSGRSGL